MARYGWDVVTYYSLPYRDRVNPAMAIRWVSQLVLYQINR